MPSATPPIPVPVGELVANKYRVERVIGHGGMGVVVSAMHEQLRQRVAIKMLLPEAKASQHAVARFLREARAAAAVRGEHVARVLDVGELEGGAPYIVMEHLEGRDLAAVLADGGRLPVDEAVGYVLQACEAIAEAHAAGIVHRDLKPSNLFLTRRPDGTPMVKVLDFGISKALLAGAGEGTLTTTSSFVGSPTYAPPEQLVASHDVDARADLWGLGTILFEALAGRPPFVGDSVMHIASRIFNEAPTPLGELRPELPAPLVSAVMRCLAKRPDERFQDVRALAEAIAPFAPAASISAERVARIVSAHTPATSQPGPIPGVAAPSRGGAASSAGAAARRGIVVGAVAVAGVAIGFLVFSSHPEGTAGRVAASAAPIPIAASIAAAAPSAPAPPPSAPPDSLAAPTAPSGSASSTPRAAPVPTRRSPLSVGVK